jgi:hypothetical protein
MYPATIPPWARACWQKSPAPLRVVEEPLGLVDDDNWVADDWVRTAYDIISSDSRLSALDSSRMSGC